jgi:hypothetical protein
MSIWGHSLCGKGIKEPTYQSVGLAVLAVLCLSWAHSQVIYVRKVDVELSLSNEGH